MESLNTSLLKNFFYLCWLTIREIARKLQNPVVDLIAGVTLCDSHHLDADRFPRTLRHPSFMYRFCPTYSYKSSRLFRETHRLASASPMACSTFSSALSSLHCYNGSIIKSSGRKPLTTKRFPKKFLEYEKISCKNWTTAINSPDFVCG